MSLIGTWLLVGCGDDAAVVIEPTLTVIVSKCLGLAAVPPAVATVPRIGAGMPPW